jgi:hypothetical protein
MQTRLARAIDALDPADRDTLARGLGQLVRAMGADTTAPPMFFEAGG